MRGLISAAVIAVAVLLQLAVADRIAFPGGAGPDLVLLTVAALALANGPMAGVLTGFCAGLALDVAPPAGHLVGQDALVFCLVGYACGLLATGPAVDGVAEQEHSALFEIGVTAAGAVCGEALAAGLGVMLSDPRVTWSAIKHVLPVAIGYDVLLSPFVLIAVAAMLRLAGGGAPVSRSAASAAAGAARRRAAWSAVPSAGAVRQVTGTNAPRLKLSAQGKGDGWLSGARGTQGQTGAARSGTARREPRFAKGSGGALSPSRGGIGSGSLLSGSARSGPTRFSSSVMGSPRRSGRWRPPVNRGRLAGARLGASLLGGSVFSGSSPLFARVSPLSGPRGNGSNGLAGTRQPRFRKASMLSRVASRVRSPAQRKAPGKGWLRGVSSGGSRIRTPLATPRMGLGGRSPGRGWLRRSRGLGAAKIGPRLGSSHNGPARLRMRPRTLKKSWRRSGGFR